MADTQRPSLPVTLDDVKAAAMMIPPATGLGATLMAPPAKLM